MSHYRKVDVKIWNDEKFVSLSVEGKLGFIMLLTHPMMTALGAMRGTLGGIAEELCCGDEGRREAFREGLRDVFRKGMAEADEKASLIVLPNFLKYNLPESPNVVKAWVKAAELIPEGPLKNRTIQRAVGFAEAMSKGFAEAIPIAFRNAVSKASPKASPNQRAESTEPRAKVQVGSGGEELSPTHTHVREAPPALPQPSANPAASSARSGHPDWLEVDWQLHDKVYAEQIEKGDSEFQARRYTSDKVESARAFRASRAEAPAAFSIHPEPLPFSSSSRRPAAARSAP